MTRATPATSRAKPRSARRQRSEPRWEQPEESYGARGGSRPVRQPLLDGAPRWLPAVAVGVGPAVGAVLGKVSGNYSGPVFAVLCTLTAVLATAAATSDGQWWVLPAVPPVVWLTAVAAELSWHNPPYVTSKDKGVGLARATTHAFPVIVAAEILMVLMVVFGAIRARRTEAGGV